MKTVNLGSWETDALKGPVPAVWRQAVPRDIVVHGYQLTLGVRPTSPGWLQGGAGVVLFRLMYSGESETWPVATMQNISRGGGAGSNFLALAALEYAAPTPVNMPLTMSGLAVPIAAGQVLIMQADQAGFGPVDFEVQGVMFYV